jgi:hypothetical protein
MTDLELIQQALKMIRMLRYRSLTDAPDEIIAALEKRLATTPPAAQPAPVLPQGWSVAEVTDGHTTVWPMTEAQILAVGLVPAAQWVGLTDADKREFAAAQYSWDELCSAVDQRLQEKNT